jgi:hypothetical protein
MTRKELVKAINITIDEGLVDGKFSDKWLARIQTLHGMALDSTDHEVKKAGWEMIAAMKAWQEKGNDDTALVAALRSVKEMMI